jgi:hypothetical protein
VVYIRFGSVDTGILLEIGKSSKPPLVLSAALVNMGLDRPSAASRHHWGLVQIPPQRASLYGH